MDYAVDRMRMDPPPLDHPRTEAELRADAGNTITAKGMGGEEAMRVFAEVLAPACLSIDHPRYFSFVPAAPTEASVLFDLVLGATCVYGGSWLEGAGAVFAENEALRWLADVAGLPAEAGGVFVSGGTAANLSALVAARYRWRRGHPEREAIRPVVVSGASAHSSVIAAARVMDADIVAAPGDERGRLTGQSLRARVDSMARTDRDRVFAVVATAGSTNLGVVDDLAGVADVAAELGAWLHVDGAYGGAALLADSARHLFVGVERADSFVVDPHKWLFAPFDCAALLYRDPAVARAAHTQHAEYLDALNVANQWNPSDYAYHLTRRARGMPLWFSLATYGTDAYRDAVEHTLRVTRRGAELVRHAHHLELVMEPELSVLVFRRLGWQPDDYQAWSDRLLVAGTAFVVPTTW
ncbi:MAG: L-2,4-diaminobutyrate decarboxylase [Acidimicrobiaceae bacterium]|nr:L-2,4-diaminobutyrate decarboxylase [Acidimicrobiaceae bacterium]